jgi:hypothetical protein
MTDERIRVLTVMQREFIQVGLAIFEQSLDRGASVTLGDLDDDTLEQVIALCDATDWTSVAEAMARGGALGARYYLHTEGNPALPHTCRTLVKLRPITIGDVFEARRRAAGLALGCDSYSAADFEQQDLAMLGGCHGCGETLGAWNAYPDTNGLWACPGCVREGYPSVEAFELAHINEECENHDCAGCPWCDVHGITVEPLLAIARVLESPRTPETYEQLLEQIEAIVRNARPAGAE